MSSVRARIEREQQQQETPAPARPRSPLTTAVVTASTRERAGVREFGACPERLTPIDKHRATGMSSYHPNANSGVRSRLDRQRATEEARSEQPMRTAAAEFYLAEYDREQALKRQRELDDQHRQQERERKIKEQEQQNLKNWNINLAFSQAPGGPPTADERRLVLAALQKFPDANPAEKAVSILLTLRGAI